MPVTDPDRGGQAVPLLRHQDLDRADQGGVRPHQRDGLLRPPQGRFFI